jgi:serine/threonine-protein kinase
MYEMLAGRVPFESDTYMGVLTKHMYVEPPRPSVVAGREQHSQLEDIVLRCMSKNPEARFDSMATLLHEFDRAFPGARTSAVPNPSATATPVAGAADRARSRLYRPWLWVAAAMALAGIAAIAVHLGTDRAVPAESDVPPYGTTELPDPIIGPVSPVRASSPDVDEMLFPKPAFPAAKAPGAAETTGPEQGLDHASSDAPRTARPDHRGHGSATRHAHQTPTRGVSPADTTGEIIDPWARKQ